MLMIAVDTNAMNIEFQNVNRAVIKSRESDAFFDHDKISILEKHSHFY